MFIVSKNIVPDSVCNPDFLNGQIVNVTLCGQTTQFDTMLSIYEKLPLVRGVQNLLKVACNDDFCMSASGLSMIPLLKGRVYLFVSSFHQICNIYF